MRKVARNERKNREAMASFQEAIAEATAFDYSHAFETAANTMVRAGVAVRLDKAAIHANAGTLVRVVGYCHLNGKDELVQITSYDGQQDKFSVVVVNDHTRGFTTARVSLMCMAAAHRCTLGPLKESNAELPVAELPPKGVSMALSEDGKSAFLMVGAFTGPQEQVLITSRLVGKDAGEEAERTTRHSDPTKPKVNEVPQAAVNTLMKQGKLGRFSNRVVGDVLSTIRDGGSGGMSLTGRSSQEMAVGLSNQDCLNVLAFRLVDVTVFRSLPPGTDVFQANRHPNTLIEAQRKRLTVSEVGTMLTNAKIIFHRMFNMTDEMLNAWTALFPQIMQEEMVNCEKYLPLLKYAWVQVILFNKLFNRFFPIW
jgi:hypothetical protein